MGGLRTVFEAREYPGATQVFSLAPKKKYNFQWTSVGLRIVGVDFINSRHTARPAS